MIVAAIKRLDYRLYSVRDSIMTTHHYSTIRENLKQLYLEDSRPWLVGFSGGKDSSMVASLIFDINPLS
jgi:tRNA(Ile)-lysidine synthase TilS/MesJ